MVDLGIDHCLKEMFSSIGWRDFLHLSARTYAAPTIEFLSTFARDDSARVLTFRLQGQQRRITYDTLDTIMGTYHPDSNGTRHRHWVNFKRTPNVEFWEQISGLSAFDPSNQRDVYITHPCWKIAHRILSTSIFGRLEFSQINTVELYFLYCMSQPNWSKPEFSPFFLDKCESVRNRTKGDICIGGMITLIGLGMGLQFDEPEFVPVDSKPLFLLDYHSLARMDFIRRQGDQSFIWYHDSDPVYILPHPSISAFSSHGQHTWFLPEELNFDVVPDNDTRMLDVEAYVGVDNSFEAEDHFDQSDHPTSHYLHGQSSGPHFEPPPQYQQSPQRHEDEPEFPLSIYSQLAALRLQGNRNEASIRSIQEQQARDHSYLEDLWYHFQPEGGYPPRGPPPP